MQTRLPFVQEFEFVPTHAFRGRFEEIEIIFVPTFDYVDVYFELDRRGTWFDEAFDLSERMVYARITAEQLDCSPEDVARDLEGFFSQYVR
jgi:sporulation-control protein spo0M